MARIGGINIPDNKHAVISLTYVYGIGRPSAKRICAEVGIKESTKVAELDDAELDRLRACVAKNEVEGDLRRESGSWILDVIEGCGIVGTCRSEARGQKQMPEHERALGVPSKDRF